MKKVVLILIPILAVTALLFMLNKTPHPLDTASHKIVSTTQTEKEEELVVIQKKKIEKTPENEEDSFDVFENEIFKAQVQNIANQYADTARFPVNSQPIRNSADARQPEPFEETQVETPFETESGDVISVSAAVDKFQYFSNDNINVRLSLTGVPEGAFVDAKAILAGSNGDTELTTGLEAVNANQSLLIGSMNTALVDQRTLSKEMIVKVLIDIGGESFFTTVSISYSNASAQLIGLGLVQPNGANLEIPFEYNVFLGGYYFITATLVDQQTGKPLIALQTEGRMPQGNGRLIAKAHIQALLETGSEGPYILTNIKAKRGAERGEQFDIPASTVKPEYEISAYSFSEYQNEVHEDPLAQERVEFLESLGDIQNN